jgi:hypothetical protein
MPRRRIIVMAKSDRREVEDSGRRRAGNEETAPRERKAESRKRSDAVLKETDDVLDEVDKVLRESLDLDENADDETFEERARVMVAGYIQKTGQ